MIILCDDFIFFILHKPWYSLLYCLFVISGFVQQQRTSLLSKQYKAWDMTNIAIYNGSPITRPCLYLMQKRVLASLDTHGKWQNVTTYILFTSYEWIMDSKCYHIVLKVSTNNQKSILSGSFDNTYYRFFIIAKILFVKIVIL